MERLVALLLVAGALCSCAPTGPESFEPRFASAVTAVWISRYDEDPESHRFSRTKSWGQIPEKMLADGQGGYSAAVPLLRQGEDSDGPLPDEFWTLLVRVVRTSHGFTLVPNDALAGPYQEWHDGRTVWLRGDSWQFKGRY